MAANFSSFHLELNNLNTYLAWACFRATGVRTKQIWTTANSAGKISIHS